MRAMIDSDIPQVFFPGVARDVRYAFPRSLIPGQFINRNTKRSLYFHVSFF